MNKYSRVHQIKEKSVTAENEIRVTSRGKTAAYVAYASKMFNEKSLKNVKVVATGTALPTAVTIGEILKRRFKGLRQIVKVGSMEIVNEYEPLEEGLDNVTDVRHVSFIELLLSLEPLDEDDKGYQAPLPESEVVEMSAEDMLRGVRRQGKGKGHQGKGKGRGKRGAKGKGGGKGGKSSRPAKGDRTQE
eukprot:GEMP01051237.1.p1 GENE.GEMP01051237.1~~GEMP01051237.1.p1  ORF type:complete len:189 (+),score=64.96 GEMP01051237.1:30-596(+)